MDKYICAVCGQEFTIDGDPDGDIYNGYPICEECSIHFWDLENITEEDFNNMGKREVK